MTKYVVHAELDPFGVDFGRSSMMDNVLVAGTRPAEWLLLGSRPETTRVAGTAGESATRVDLTHGRALLSITGSKAADVLAKLCDVDFSDHMTPDGAVASGSVAAIVCDVIRRDEGDEPSYLLLFDRSYGPYLASAIESAMAEFLSGGSVI